MQGEYLELKKHVVGRVKNKVDKWGERNRRKRNKGGKEKEGKEKEEEEAKKLEEHI